MTDMEKRFIYRNKNSLRALERATIADNIIAILANSNMPLRCMEITDIYYRQYDIILSCQKVSYILNCLWKDKIITRKEVIEIDAITYDKWGKKTGKIEKCKIPTAIIYFSLI